MQIDELLPHASQQRNSFNSMRGESKGFRVAPHEHRMRRVDLANPCFYRLRIGLSAAATDGYRIVVGNTSETASSELTLALALLHQTDGVFLCGPRRLTIGELHQLADHMSPIVCVTRISPQVRIPSDGR